MQKIVKMSIGMKEEIDAFILKTERTFEKTIACFTYIWYN